MSEFCTTISWVCKRQNWSKPNRMNGAVGKTCDCNMFLNKYVSLFVRMTSWTVNLHLHFGLADSQTNPCNSHLPHAHEAPKKHTKMPEIHNHIFLFNGSVEQNRHGFPRFHCCEHDFENLRTGNYPSTICAIHVCLTMGSYRQC